MTTEQKPEGRNVGLSAGLAVLPFNINESVLVRLNETGRTELRRQHDELTDTMRARGRKGWEYLAPTEDSEGWSKWQLWDLMSQLGHLCRLGSEPPFETVIRICTANDQLKPPRVSAVGLEAPVGRDGET